jgi:hypothetical protein
MTMARRDNSYGAMSVVDAMQIDGESWTAGGTSQVTC